MVSKQRRGWMIMQQMEPKELRADPRINSQTGYNVNHASVIEVAEGIPFTTITGMSVEKLYALKGEIVSRGVKAVTGLEMPLFPKRRFQHGAVPVERLRERVSGQESEYRKQFLALYN